MKRYRDAETGEYLTKEEALKRDPKTWVTETVKQTVKEVSVPSEVESHEVDVEILHNHLLNEYEVIGDEAVVKVVNLEKVLKRFGLDE